MNKPNAKPLFCITYSFQFHLFILFFFTTLLSYSQNQNFVIDNTFPYLVNEQTLGRATTGGDTLFISSARTNPLRFQFTNGNVNSPLVVINKGGQVKISSPNSYSWGAITFENCKYIKISGSGHPNFKYGFELSADECGLAFSELSSDCEAEFVKISHDGFFGIMAKKNYEGNPPFPYPVFENLIIHDCFIEGVSEGMYLGETKSPGMEFKHVKIYNNIVRNTLRESIQIANMVEDIEIYNNTMLNAGLENAYYHTNILQIGDNSVVNAYNNIISDAPAFGIINVGKGNCSFTNNYISSNLGIFNDDRSISDTLAPINISQNYFRTTTSSEVVRNMNQINYLNINDNNYDTDVPFYLNQTNNPNNYTLSNNVLTTVDSIQFTDPSTNDYSLTSSNPIEYQNLGAPGGPEYFDPVPEVITITPSMVTDSVSGGSVYTPLYLFDEQSLNIDNNEHAISNSWKPYYNMNNAPYHVTIDLGKHYFISEINLHDMNDSFDFTIEHGTPEGWSPLLTDPCNTFNIWSRHTTNVTTRFLRLSMLQSPYASVNEMIIYGYPATIESNQIVITANMITDEVAGGSVYSPLYLFDEQTLDLSTGEHPVSESWKPYFTMANAPYYTVIDLGQSYHLSEINIHDMNSTFDFTIKYGSHNNWTTLLTDHLDKFQFWNKHLTDVTTRYLRLSTPESPYAAVNEILIYGYPDYLIPEQETEQEPNLESENNNQIVITNSMVIDSVQGGSVNSPLFLFDEQGLNDKTGEHPISNSWKPDYIMNNSSYHTIVDLGQEYEISEINLHDMNATFDFTVEYGAPSNWTTLFVDPCDTFNTWSTNAVNITTRYIRLSMYQDINANVNEIIIYGHLPNSNTSKSSNGKNKKGANIETETTIENSNFSTDVIKLSPNPIDQNLNLKFPQSMVGKNNIQIKDILGKTIYNTDISISNKSALIEIDASNIKITSGYYILMCEHESGERQILKFIKK